MKLPRWFHRFGSPPYVYGLADVIAVAAGGAHTCALKDNGALWCWGSNWDGEVGIGILELAIGRIWIRCEDSGLVLEIAQRQPGTGAE